MPFNIDDIEREQRPLSQKIYDHLASHPRKAFTLEEIRSALGGGPPLLTPLASNGGELLFFLLADIGLAALADEYGQGKQEQYKLAVLSLVLEGRARAFEYQGHRCYAVSRAALPSANPWALKAASK